jgi:hypothetical protein
MPVVDECLVIEQWQNLSPTERAFERLSSSDLYRKKCMIDLFRQELRAYELQGGELTASQRALAYVITPTQNIAGKNDENQPIA